MTIEKRSKTLEKAAVSEWAAIYSVKYCCLLMGKEYAPVEKRSKGLEKAAVSVWGAQKKKKNGL